MAVTAAESARLSSLEVEGTARREVTRAISSMVTAGADRTLTPLRTRARTVPSFKTVQPEPIAQIEAAHALEQTAHALIGDLIRLVHQAGRSRYEIGSALDLHRHVVAARESIADVAYYIALEHQPGSCRQTFTWTGPACNQLVTDHGLSPEMPDREEDQADGCARWAAELAEWQEYERAMDREAVAAAWSPTTTTIATTSR